MFVDPEPDWLYLWNLDAPEVEAHRCKQRQESPSQERLKDGFAVRARRPAPSAAVRAKRDDQVDEQVPLGLGEHACVSYSRTHESAISREDGPMLERLGLEVA